MISKVFTTTQQAFNSSSLLCRAVSADFQVKLPLLGGYPRPYYALNLYYGEQKFGKGGFIVP